MGKTCFKVALCGFLCYMATTMSVLAQGNSDYQVPPKEIADLILAEPTPLSSINSQGTWMALLQPAALPDISALAQPELRLAGIRINPNTFGESRAASYYRITFKSTDGKQERPVTGLPENPVIENFSWSPKGDFIAFTLSEEKGLSLWVAATATGVATKLTQAQVNDVLGGLPYQWHPDNLHLIYRAVPTGHGPMPEKPLAPSGPTIQENLGVMAANRTYQDLLQNPYDESVFEHFASTELWKVSVNREMAKLGEKAIYSSFSVSPDGLYLLVQTIQKPFSYLVPYTRFPLNIRVVGTNDGQLVKDLATIPLADNLPKGFDAVRQGPRSFGWRSDTPATLYWAEAQDEGDPARQVAVRDKLFSLQAPFQAAPTPGLELTYRYNGIAWSSGNLALVYESWWNTRRARVSRFAPDGTTAASTIFDYSYEDAYNDPGDFQTVRNQAGKDILLQGNKGRTLYLFNQGASPSGNRPFVESYELATGRKTKIWQAAGEVFETPVRLVDADKGLLITRSESKQLPPNFLLRDLKKRQVSPLTEFKNPYPAMEGVTKTQMVYRRNDGVQLTGTLYLPANFKKEDGPLPLLMWAYPREFKSADAAGQVKSSPYEFTRLSWRSPVFWVLRGYAVLDDASMPIVGEKDEEPNDTFVRQLVANAAAAIDTLASMGVADPKRVAVGGHSYGAFMTANLLAHSNLFAAGIARSGAYNRTLTPFGFQAEQRTYWEAPEVYNTMSPFMFSNRIKTPILLIHGEADNNSGTFPIQSERFYSALKGHGATVRYVSLPHESHGYSARQSILHMLWEQDTWLEKYVKNKSEQAGE